MSSTSQTRPAPPDFAFADPRRLVADVFSVAFLPPEQVSVADYAAEHRWLSNEGGGYVGRWRHEMVPYLVEPMALLTSPAISTIAIVGPGQSAKTTSAENWLLQAVCCDPADMLWYMQTEPSLESYVKRRIDPMIAAHEGLKSRLGTRSTDNSLHYKRFDAMAIEFLTATHANLINKSAPRIIVDEVDAYPEDLGDILSLVNVRRQTFGAESMVLGISHPDRAGGVDPRKWNAGIMAWYGDSDRRTWWCRCPHCDAPSCMAPIGTRAFALDYPADAALDVVEREARLVCPVNGCLIDDAERRNMLVTGLWLGTGQDIDEAGVVTGERVTRAIAGFWITGIMSPFAYGGIGGLAAARVKAQREFEATGDDDSLRQVIVKQWGLPYDGAHAASDLDATALADRAEDFPLGIVPPGVRFLTAFVDVQANRFEILVRGWGEARESWIVDFRTLAAEPAQSPEDWDTLLGSLIEGAWPLGDDTGRVMRLRGIGVDSAGAPGTTEQVYAAWRRWKGRRLVRKLGVIGGRDAWSFLPTKGLSGLNAKSLSVVYPDTARADRRAAARGEIPLATFNPNWFKDALAGQLKRAEPGPGFVHFPRALRSDEVPHLWFEQITAERPKKERRMGESRGAQRGAGPAGRLPRHRPSARGQPHRLVPPAHLGGGMGPQQPHRAAGRRRTLHP